MNRFARIVIASGTLVACSENGPANNRQPPEWIGTYAVLADSSAHCHEEISPAGRSCICDTYGHYEGTLSLDVDVDGEPTGSLTVRECLPGRTPSCDDQAATFAVMKYQAPPPPPGTTLPTSWLRFCADGCPFAGNNAWAFWVPSSGSNLIGRFSRSDGNVRACGADLGPFTATRQ
jgi:hypothetical protein